MEKTVTKSEVERVLNNEFRGLRKSKERILNELFPPEFKAGDWVVGWHISFNQLHDNAWQIDWFDENGQAVPVGKPHYGTRVNHLRHATPEEIAAAEWEEGKPYRVWLNGRWVVRVSSSVVSRFYIYGEFDGDTCKFDKYEKL